MHREAYEFFQSELAKVPARQAVVEIGARNVNGSLRYLFMQQRPKYVGVDIAPGPLVDVVEDGATFAPEFAPDTVLCAEVLEHTDQAKAICENAHAMLQQGGLFLLSAAAPDRQAHSAVDGGVLRDHEFYQNVNPVALRYWLRDFAKVDVRHHSDRGDVYAVAWK